MDITLLRLMYFTLTVLKLQFFWPHYIWVGLIDFMDCLPAPLVLLLPTCQLANSFEMVLFPASVTCLAIAICRALLWWVPHTTAFASVNFFCTLGATHSCFCTFCLTMSNSFASFMWFSVNFCALCTSTPCAYSNTHSLVVPLMSSSVATSFRISLIISSSFSPLINCSVSSLSYSLYWHSATLVLSLTILSWADSLLFLCSLWYCSDIIIPLCYSLIVLHNTANRPFVVLHFSFFFLSECLYELQTLLA